jgi:hypothetical protein
MPFCKVRDFSQQNLALLDGVAVPALYVPNENWNVVGQFNLPETIRNKIQKKKEDKGEVLICISHINEKRTLTLLPLSDCSMSGIIA